MYAIKNYTVCFILFFLVLNCSKHPQNTVEFIPEFTIGEHDNNDAWFGALSSFFVGSNDTIFCLDNQEKKVKVFNKQGLFLYDFGREGNGPGEFLNPNSMVVSADNMVYVSDNRRKTISKFSSSGKFLFSKAVEHILVKMGSFNSGNLLVEIAEIDVRNIEKSNYKLSLFDNNLNLLKETVFEQNVSNLTWIDTTDGKMFTVQIPFAPQMIWKIVDNILYVGYNDEYDIRLFDENGRYLKKITKDITRHKVTSRDKRNWIKQMVNRLADRPNVSKDEMKKSLEKTDIPRFKPYFTKILCYNNSVIILGNPTVNGTVGTLYNTEGIEKAQLWFPYDDFEYFSGKYYRITGGDDQPYTLTRYRINNE